MLRNRKKQNCLISAACVLGLISGAGSALAQEQGGNSGGPVGTTSDDGSATRAAPDKVQPGLTNTPLCTAQFDFNSVEFDREALRECFDKNQHTQWSELSVTGWASPEGSKGYNQTLSERRATAMAEYLKEQIADVNISQVEGRGESGDIGRAAQIFVTQVNDPSVSQNQVIPPASEADAEATVVPNEGADSATGSEGTSGDVGGVLPEDGVEGPEATVETEDGQTTNPGFAPGPDFTPEGSAGEGEEGTAPSTPTVAEGLDQTAPAQDFDVGEAREMESPRKRDYSWLGAFGLFGLAPFLRKRRSGVR